MLIAPRLVGCGASPPAVRTPSLLKGAWRGHQAPLEGPDSASNQGRVAMDVRVSRAPRPPAGHRRGHRLPGTPRPLRPRPGLTVRAAGLRMEWSADQGARLIGRLVSLQPSGEPVGAHVAALPSCPRQAGPTADVTDPSQKALPWEAAPLRSALTRPASRVLPLVSGTDSSKMSRNCKTDT
ncbi:unnamed protein product [Rangifer tarandus platyrhynchus]|uniref:Uncharacterized protein n=1 Tax=Rangifer tarandus platyrhynchus TaxID=3082113 RepID=A0AC59ZMW0_RANTA